MAEHVGEGPDVLLIGGLGDSCGSFSWTGSLTASPDSLRQPGCPTDRQNRLGRCLWKCWLATQSHRVACDRSSDNPRRQVFRVSGLIPCAQWNQPRSSRHRLHSRPSPPLRADCSAKANQLPVAAAISPSRFTDIGGSVTVTRRQVRCYTSFEASSAAGGLNSVLHGVVGLTGPRASDR